MRCKSGASTFQSTGTLNVCFSGSYFASAGRNASITALLNGLSVMWFFDTDTPNT